MLSKDDYIKLFEDAKIAFMAGEAQKLEEGSPIQVFEKNIDGKIYRVFGIENNSQTPEIIQAARARILAIMGHEPTAPVVQIVGDSASFGHAESAFAKHHLREELAKFERKVILYGYTGHFDHNGYADCSDVNELVSQVITEQDARTTAVLANLVDHHSKVAIQSWGCTIGDVDNFFLVYGPKKVLEEGKASAPGALFGDDVISSDYFVDNGLMGDSQRSIGICLEGGVQSFNQVRTMLEKGIPVVGIGNLRGINNKNTYNPTHNRYMQFFSALEFLTIIKGAFEQNPQMTAQDVIALKNTYIYDKEIHGDKYDFDSGLRLLANPFARDYDTKANLFKEAWQQFLETEGWKNLDLLSIRSYVRPELADVITVNPRPTILFCDPGVDDALMLAYALANKRQIEILGIVAGAGNVSRENTIKNTLGLLNLTQRNDVGVYPGCLHPMNISTDEMRDGTHVYGEDGLSGIEFPVGNLKAQTVSGVDFSVETISNASPDKPITIVSTGGLTDLSHVLLALETGSPDKLKNIDTISIMGGAIYTNYHANAKTDDNNFFAEFNMIFDPTATKNVFDICRRHGIRILLAPTDVTHTVLCGEKQVEQMRATNNVVASRMADLAGAIPPHYRVKFGSDYPAQPIHDAVAIVCLDHPELFSYSQGMIEVEQNGEAIGKTTCTLSNDGNVYILHLPAEKNPAFFRHFSDNLGRYSIPTSSMVPQMLKGISVEQQASEKRLQQDDQKASTLMYQ